MTFVMLYVLIFLSVTDLVHIATSSCISEQKVDGCSIPFNSSFPYRVIFKKACNRHDVCYRCGKSFEWSRRECDKGFLYDMYEECEKSQRNEKKSINIAESSALLGEEDLYDVAASKNLKKELQILDKKMKNSKQGKKQHKNHKRSQRSTVEGELSEGQKQETKKEHLEKKSTKKESTARNIDKDSDQKKRSGEEKMNISADKREKEVSNEDDKIEKKAMKDEESNKKKIIKVRENEEKKETMHKNTKKTYSTTRQHNRGSKKEQSSKINSKRSKCKMLKNKSCSCHRTRAKKQMQKKSNQMLDVKRRHERIIQILKWLDDLLKLEQKNLSHSMNNSTKLRNNNTHSSHTNSNHKHLAHLNQEIEHRNKSKEVKMKENKSKKDKIEEKMSTGEEEEAREATSKDNKLQGDVSKDERLKMRKRSKKSKHIAGQGKKRQEKQKISHHQTRKRLIDHCKVTAHLYYLAVRGFARKFYRDKTADWCTDSCVPKYGKPHVRIQRRPRKIM